jgi:hypothetical protein
MKFLLDENWREYSDWCIVLDRRIVRNGINRAQLSHYNVNISLLAMEESSCPCASTSSRVSSRSESLR